MLASRERAFAPDVLTRPTPCLVGWCCVRPREAEDLVRESFGAPPPWALREAALLGLVLASLELPVLPRRWPPNAPLLALAWSLLVKDPA